jgi:hypothetical protein
MDNAIERKFDEMGARVRIRPLQPHLFRSSRETSTGWPRLDVLRDRRGPALRTVRRVDPATWVKVRRELPE